MKRESSQPKQLNWYHSAITLGKIHSHFTIHNAAISLEFNSGRNAPLRANQNSPDYHVIITANRYLHCSKSLSAYPSDQNI